MTMQTPEQQAYEAAHARADTDGDRSSIHHTLGRSPNQAAPGNHSHSDLAADDHNHDLTYAPLDHSHTDLESITFEEIPAGKTLVLKKAVTGPAAPTVTFLYYINNYTPVTSGEVTVGGYHSDGYIYTAGSDNIYRTPDAGGVQELIANLGSHLYNIKGIHYKDTYWYILADPSAGGNSRIFKFDLYWNLISSLTLASSPLSLSGLTWRGSEWVVCYANGTDELQIRFINSSTGDTSYTVNTTLPYDPDIIRAVNILYGGFDYGVNRFVIALAGFSSANNKLYVYNDNFTPTRVAADEWPLNDVVLNGLSWDSSELKFKQVSSSSVVEYSDDILDLSRKVAGTSVNEDGTQVSLLGGQKSYTHVKRTFAKVVYPEPGSDVISIDTYIAKQSDSLFKKQDVSSKFVSSRLTKYFGKPNWAGVDPPGASTWPAAVGAKIMTDDGIYYFNADGDAHFRSLTSSKVYEDTVVVDFDASGDGYIPHPLGVTPKSVVLTQASHPAQSLIWTWDPPTSTSSQIRTKCRNDAGAASISVSRTVSVRMVAP